MARRDADQGRRSPVSGAHEALRDKYAESLHKAEGMRRAIEAALA